MQSSTCETNKMNFKWKPKSLANEIQMAFASMKIVKCLTQNSATHKKKKTVVHWNSNIGCLSFFRLSK